MLEVVLNEIQGGQLIENSHPVSLQIFESESLGVEAGTPSPARGGVMLAAGGAQGPRGTKTNERVRLFSATDATNPWISFKHDALVT